MTAIMGFSSVAMAGQDAVLNIFSENAIVAEAANDNWFPFTNTFNVYRANNYASISSSSVKSVLSSGTGSMITDSNGVFRNYKVVYSSKRSNAVYSDDVVLLYDAAKHPDLALTTNQWKVSAFIERVLQFINTERQMSGLSHQRLIIVADWKNSQGQSIVGDTCYYTNNVVELSDITSQELTHGVTKFSSIYMPWKLLHECSHACGIEGYDQSVFNTDDEVFTEFRTVCAIRELHRNGITFPDVLRNRANGDLNCEGRSYIHYSALQYYSDDAAFQCPGYLSGSVQRLRNIGVYQNMYVRASILFDQGANLTLWSPNIVSNRTFADQLETESYYDNGWNKLYTLCITNPNNITASFMSRPKNWYNRYANSRTNSIRVCRFNRDNSPITAQDVTPNVAAAIQFFNDYAGGNGYGYWDCTLSTLRLYNVYDFLFGDTSTIMFKNHLMNKADGHNSIRYCDIAQIVAR